MFQIIFYCFKNICYKDKYKKNNKWEYIYDVYILHKLISKIHYNSLKMNIMINV